MTAADAPVRALRAGIGLRQPHYAQWLDEPPDVGFVEVHSENFYADGGAALSVLQQVRERVPVSLHGVGLALGSAAGVDPWHLERLDRLVRATDPFRVSDHVCFARAPLQPDGPVLHANDLLPVAYTAASLDILCANVGRVQDRLQRPLLVENLSAYLRWTDDDQPEADFLAALCRRSGCGLLLDVNNLMVNALNQRAADPVASACATLDALPRSLVGEIHLAGYTDTRRPDSADLVIDDHGSVVRPGVWTLYEHALRRFGAVPTLVEWDTDLPPLAVLLGEAAQADQRLAALDAAVGQPPSPR